MGLSKRVGSFPIKLPTLRFRAKIMLGFAVTLAISAASMGIAYLGFERVSAGVIRTGAASQKPIWREISTAS